MRRRIPMRHQILALIRILSQRDHDSEADIATSLTQEFGIEFDAWDASRVLRPLRGLNPYGVVVHYVDTAPGDGKYELRYVDGRSSDRLNETRRSAYYHGRKTIIKRSRTLAKNMANQAEVLCMYAPPREAADIAECQEMLEFVARRLERLAAA